jgi:hypothetical protein
MAYAIDEYLKTCSFIAMEERGESVENTLRGRWRKTTSARIKLNSRGDKLSLNLMKFGSLHRVQNDLLHGFSEAMICKEVLLQLVLG